LKQSNRLQRQLTKAEAEKFDVTRFTVEMWARNPKVGDNSDSATLFHCRYVKVSLPSHLNLYTSDTHDYLGIAYLAADGSYVTSVYSNQPNWEWEKDRWYHIVFTYDANSSAPDDSIITITRTPEGETAPDFSQTLTDMKDMSPFMANGNLMVGGSSVTSLPRHWGGDIDNVKFFNGIPQKYLIAQDK